LILSSFSSFFGPPGWGRFGFGLEGLGL